MEAAASSCLSAILSKIGGYLVDLCVPKANYLLRFKNNVEDLKKEAGYLRGTRDRVQNKVERAKRNIEEIDEDVKEWLMEVDNILEEIQRLEDDIKGCTILLTTRLQEVCIGMRCQPRIRLNILSDDDALTLFKKHADICDSPELNAVAKEVVGECGGLPIAIKAVGIALRENFEWNVVSKKLKLSKFPDIETTSADEKKVYPCLRLSYDYLEDEETKFCFLLCSLFPEDYEIDLEELLRYGLGLDLYGDDAESIEDARSLLRFTTNKLKSSCLLLDAKEGFVKMHDLQRLPKDFVLPKKLLRYDIRVNDDDYGEGPSYPKSRLLKIRGIEATSLVAFKALYENVEYLELVGIKRCCQNMVPSIDETGLNELKRLSLESFDELDCIIDTTQQQDVASTAFSNLVDLSLRSCDGLREICSGGRPPRGFIENLETLKISVCHSMSCLFPSWMLIQSLQKLKEVNIEYCGELEDVFQLEGLCYAKENPFLLSSLESLDLKFLRNLRYIWKGPTQQVSLQSLTVVKVVLCHQLRYLFTLSLARSLLQLEQLKVWRCGSLEHIVEIKEAEENVGGGGGNDVMFPKLRILKLDVLENFISFFDSENYSSTWPALQELSLYLPLNSTTSFVAQLEANVLQKLRVLEVGIISDQLCNSVLAQLIHGFQNLEELTIRNCRVQVLSQLELSLPSLKVLKLEYLRELEWLCKGPTHLLSLPNLTKLSVDSCNRLRHMFSPSLARNLLQLEELIIENCGELEQIFNEDDAAECNQTLSKDHLRWPLLFPNLSSIGIWRCDKLKSMFPVSMAHLLSLQNLTTLRLSDCHGLTHLFSSTHARNLLQLESIDIVDCGDLEQIIVEDHTEDDHVLLLPQLKKLTLHNLQSLVNFCPVGYHFIFPSLSKLWMTKCPKLTTRFSVDQNRSVHTETKAPQKGKEDVDMEQSSPETTKEIEWWDFDDLQSQLPPYIGK
ncbi:hypothetical protein Q3G72_022297 [Acer saccharum]|nr:hypothetical protein Q3G72_022297 [Acer saccharum]